MRAGPRRTGRTRERVVRTAGCRADPARPGCVAGRTPWAGPAPPVACRRPVEPRPGPAAVRPAGVRRPAIAGCLPTLNASPPLTNRSSETAERCDHVIHELVPTVDDLQW